jgi:hypothetical protein
MSLEQVFTLKTVHAETTSIHGMEVTPEAQVLAVKLPVAGFAWNRPVAVRVGKDGQEQRIPIVDATRMAQLGIYAFAVLLTLIVWRVTSHDAAQENRRTIREQRI